MFPAVAEVEWDSGGQAKSCSDTLGWDGTKSTSTVEQLTRHSLDKLGSQGEWGWVAWFGYACNFHSDHTVSKI